MYAKATPSFRVRSLRVVGPFPLQRGNSRYVLLKKCCSKKTQMNTNCAKIFFCPAPPTNRKHIFLLPAVSVVLLQQIENTYFSFQPCRSFSSNKSTTNISPSSRVSRSPPTNRQQIFLPTPNISPGVDLSVVLLQQIVPPPSPVPNSWKDSFPRLLLPRCRSFSSNKSSRTPSPKFFGGDLASSFLVDVLHAEKGQRAAGACLPPQPRPARGYLRAYRYPHQASCLCRQARHSCTGKKNPS